jgi:hypothetical protein
MSYWNPEPGDEWYIDPEEMDAPLWTWPKVIYDVLIVLCVFALVAVVCGGAGYVYGS